jgi:prepilin-type processing-associated H-X9-DG protein
VRAIGGEANRRGVALLEVLIAVGVIAILAALLIPVAVVSRESAKATRCASNLRELHRAFAIYAADHRGVLPRYGSYGEHDGPVWVTALARVLLGTSLSSWSQISDLSVLQCPSHPTVGIPTAFVLNTFDFASEPGWRGAGPIQYARLRNPANLPWLLETPDLFLSRDNVLYDDIFFEPWHVLRKPDHLPGGSAPRTSYVRHRTRYSNVLFADGHVRNVRPGELRLEQFDHRRQ